MVESDGGVAPDAPIAGFGASALNPESDERFQTEAERNASSIARAEAAKEQRDQSRELRGKFSRELGKALAQSLDVDSRISKAAGDCIAHLADDAQLADDAERAQAVERVARKFTNQVSSLRKHMESYAEADIVRDAAVILAAMAHSKTERNLAGVKVSPKQLKRRADDLYFADLGPDVTRIADAISSSSPMLESRLGDAIYAALKDRVDALSGWNRRGTPPEILRKRANDAAHEGVQNLWRLGGSLSAKDLLRYSARQCWQSVLSASLAAIDFPQLARLTGYPFKEHGGFSQDRKAGFLAWVLEVAELVDARWPTGSKPLELIALFAPRPPENRGWIEFDQGRGEHGEDATGETALGQADPDLSARCDHDEQQTYEPEPAHQDGNGADSIDQAQKLEPAEAFDCGDAKVFAGVFEVATQNLRRAVRSARRKLSGTEWCDYLDLIDKDREYDEYDPAAMLKKLREHGRCPPDPRFGPAEQAARDVANANLYMTRAYKQLQTQLSEHGFLRLEDLGDQSSLPDAITARITQAAKRRLLLPRGLVKPIVEADGSLEVNLDVRESAALRLEQAGMTIAELASSLVAHDPDLPDHHCAKYWCEHKLAVLAELKSARAKMLTAYVVAPYSLRFSLEAVVKATEVPDEPKRATQLDDGRVVVLPATAIPIEARSDDHVIVKQTIPELPRWLSKRHSGRWWWFPGGGVGMKRKGAGNGA